MATLTRVDENGCNSSAVVSAEAVLYGDGLPLNRVQPLEEQCFHRRRQAVWKGAPTGRASAVLK